MTDNPRHDPGCGGMVIPVALQQTPQWCCPPFERWAARPDARAELLRELLASDPRALTPALTDREDRAVR